MTDCGGIDATGPFDVRYRTAFAYLFFGLAYQFLSHQTWTDFFLTGT